MGKGIMRAEYRVLLVEGSDYDAEEVVRELKRGGLSVSWKRVDSAARFRAALRSKQWDVVICDFLLPGLGGFEVLALYRRAGLDIPFIMVTGTVSGDDAVEILKAGAHGCVRRQNLARLVPAIYRELRACQARHIRRQVEDTQAYLASIIESCDDAIVGTTIDGTVLTWNAGAERLYGYTAAEMVGRSVSILIPPCRLEELRETLDKLSRGGRVDHFETVRTRKDGSPVEVSLTISPIRDRSGRVIGISAIAHDNTRRKQEENERLNLIQDLTAALAVKNAQPDASAKVELWDTDPMRPPTTPQQPPRGWA